MTVALAQMDLKGCLSFLSRPIRRISRPYIYPTCIRQSSETGRQQLTPPSNNRLYASKSSASMSVCILASACFGVIS